MIIEQDEEKCSDYFIMGRPSCHLIPDSLRLLPLNSKALLFQEELFYWAFYDVCTHNSNRQQAILKYNMDSYLKFSNALLTM